MKKYLSLLILSPFFLTSSCTQKSVIKETSTQAEALLEKRFEDQIGKATKATVIEYFGPALWCRAKEDAGGESCRFQKKTKTIWTSEKRNYMAYDAAMTEFDANSILRAFKAEAQR